MRNTYRSTNFINQVRIQKFPDETDHLVTSCNYISVELALLKVLNVDRSSASWEDERRWIGIRSGKKPFSNERNRACKNKQAFVMQQDRGARGRWLGLGNFLEPVTDDRDLLPCEESRTFGNQFSSAGWLVVPCASKPVRKPQTSGGLNYSVRVRIRNLSLYSHPCPDITILKQPTKAEAQEKPLGCDKQSEDGDEVERERGGVCSLRLFRRILR
ncbi:predicted protein [Histoplasma capsulatum var. duboisii H88]|uniref:Predicted protein n=1 Tax=Ajellomyces capsulatus (strain H88) TaxID=544711 RepID=F0UTM5_AJEC8|nr:predicted protein [Histoplasma capsulatum var. duboisii H88]